VGAINWEQSNEPLRFNLAVKASNYAALTGRRILLREAFFNSGATAFKAVSG